MYNYNGSFAVVIVVENYLYIIPLALLKHTVVQEIYGGGYTLRACGVYLCNVSGMRVPIYGFWYADGTRRGEYGGTAVRYEEYNCVRILPLWYGTPPQIASTRWFRTTTTPWHEYTDYFSRTIRCI